MIRKQSNQCFCSALCRHWVWTEWSSCQVLCDLNGQEPVGPREHRTREKFFPDDPYNTCEGGHEVKLCDEECQSKDFTELVMIVLISQSPSPLAIGSQSLSATTPVGTTATTWSGGPAPLPAQTCPRVTLAIALRGRRPTDQETKPVSRTEPVLLVNL